MMGKGKHILWIEDDYHAIKGLVRPLEKVGFQVDVATSASDGYHKLADRYEYDLIIVDLILPLSDSASPPPPEVAAWQREKHAGVGLLKWLMRDKKPECPVLVLSVVQNPISTYGLEDLGLADTLLKRGLLPSEVKEKVFEILGLED